MDNVIIGFMVKGKVTMFIPILQILLPINDKNWQEKLKKAALGAFFYKKREYVFL